MGCGQSTKIVPIESRAQHAREVSNASKASRNLKRIDQETAENSGNASKARRLSQDSRVSSARSNTSRKSKGIASPTDSARARKNQITPESTPNNTRHSNNETSYDDRETLDQYMVQTEDIEQPNNFEDKSVYTVTYTTNEESDEQPPTILFPCHVSLKAANDFYNRKQANRQPDLDSVGIPLPHPPPSSKSELLHDHDFTHIDNHAVQAPPSLLEGTFANLVAYLTKPTRNDLEKIRVLFRWITAQQPNSLADSLSQSSPDAQRPLDMLLKIRDRRSSCEALLVKLCECANIQSTLVHGYSKHADYQIGDSVNEEKDIGTWVAVCIGSHWRLIHPSWASSHVKGGKDADWVLIDDDGRPIDNSQQSDTVRKTEYDYDEDYFFANPEESIYHHLSVDAPWQLLARPVSVQEFEQMAFLKPPFFRLGLSLKNEIRCRVYTANGKAFINIGLPKEHRTFTYSFYVRRSQKNNSVEKNELSRFVFLHQKSSDIMQAEVRCPKAGEYKLTLYCKDSADTQSLMRVVCSYIVVSEETDVVVRPLPASNRAVWGPGPDSFGVGLIPLTHTGALIEIENGELTIAFQTTQKVEILNILTGENLNGNSLETFHYHYFDDDKLFIKMKLPQSGEFVLHTFAKPEGQPGALKSVCSYLIRTINPAANRIPLPEIVNGFVGDSANFGFRLVSPKCHVIQAPASGLLQMRYTNPKRCKLLAKMTRRTATSKQDEDVTEYMCVEDNGLDAAAYVRLTELGAYLVTIYCQLPGETGITFHSACTCLILCESGTCRPIPYPPVANAIIGDMRLDEGNHVSLTSHEKAYIGVPATASGQVQLKFNVPSKCTLSANIITSPKTKADNQNFAGSLLLHQDGPSATVSLRFKDTGFYAVVLFVNGESAYICMVACFQSTWLEDPFPKFFKNQVGSIVNEQNLSVRLVSPLSPIIHATDTGELDLVFETSHQYDFEASMSFHPKGNTNEGLSVSDNLCTFQEGKRATACLRLDRFGIYVVKLWLHSVHVYTCIVFCDNGVSRRGIFPKIANQRIGQIASNEKDLGIRLISHPSPNITVSGDTQDVRLVFATPVPCDMLAKMSMVEFKALSSDAALKEVNTFVQLKQRTTEADVDIRLKDAGTYVVNIFAKPAGESTTLPLVYTCFISSDHSYPSAQPFASSYRAWLKNPLNELIAPQVGELLEASEIEFALRVPEATKMAVVNSTSNKWQYLSLHEDGVWRGLVHTGNAGDTLNVAAQLTSEAGSTNYDSLLKYFVIRPSKAYKEILESLSAFIVPPAVSSEKDSQPETSGGSAANIAAQQQREAAAQLQKEAAARQAEEARKQQLQQEAEQREQEQKRIAEELRVAEQKLQRMREAEQRRIEEQEKEDEKRIKELERLLELDKEKEKQRQRKLEEEFNKVKENLLAAISSRKVNKLKKALTSVDKHAFTTRLQEEVAAAYSLLEHLLRIDKIKHLVLALSNKKLAEAHTFAHPPDKVHPVVQAMLLLLGHHEGITKEWGRCQSLLKQKLLGLIKNFDTANLHPEIAARAFQILTAFSVDDVLKQSSVAATFYAWTMQTLEEFYRCQKDPKVMNNVRPAVGKRQEQLVEAMAQNL